MRRSSYCKKLDKLYLEDKVENIDYIVCIECGKRYQYLAHHLRHAHNITTNQYLNKHNNAKTFCEAYRKNLSITVSKGRLEKSNKHANRKVKCDLIKGAENIDYVICKICSKRSMNLGNHFKISHNITTKEYLEKYPKSKLICQKLIDNNRRKFKGIPLEERWGKEVTDKFRKTLSKDHENRRERGIYNKVSLSLKGRDYIELHGIEKANKLKNNLRYMMLGQFINGEREPFTSYSGTREYYNNIIQGKKLLKSSVESKYARILDRQSNFCNNFVWLYEPLAFELKDEIDNIYTTLTPDFFLLFDWGIDKIQKHFGTIQLTKEQIKEMISLSSDRKIEEVKGYWNVKHKSYEKWCKFKDQYPEENKEIVTAKTVQAIDRRSCNTIEEGS